MRQVRSLNEKMNITGSVQQIIRLRAPLAILAMMAVTQIFRQGLCGRRQPGRWMGWAGLGWGRHRWRHGELAKRTPISSLPNHGQARSAWLLSSWCSCAYAGNARHEAKAARTCALLLMSTDKAPYRQSETKLLVWKHLQLITQVCGCFRNHLTLT